MTKQKEIYKCEICGNIVEVLHEGVGQLVCCGQPMKLKKENSVDAEQFHENKILKAKMKNPSGVASPKEKHVPVIEGNKVKIGSEPHPMTDEHYIEWVEATDGKQISKVFLKPGQKPEAEFCFKPTKAREYCNLHGLWKSK